MIMVLTWHMSVLVKFVRVILHDVVVVVMLLLLLLLLLRLVNLSLSMIPVSQYTHGPVVKRSSSCLVRGVLAVTVVVLLSDR